jgi:hypothetical protein
VGFRAFPESIDTALKDFARRNTTSRKEDWQARLIDRPGAAEPEIWGVHAYLDPMTMLADNCRTETLDKGETVDSSRPWDSMGKGTIYNYFPEGKEAILMALIDELCGVLSRGVYREGMVFPG